MEEDRCSVPFIKVCEFLESLLNLKAKKKQQTLKDFFEKSRVNNYYPIIRLMLPHFDMERGQYGLKEKTLAKYFTEILSLPKREKEALYHFKNPGKKLPGCPAGGFVEVFYYVLQNRAPESQNMTVEEVNQKLDELSSSFDKDDKKRILTEFIKRMNALELKWICKIILKDLKLGIHERILNAFHPQALEIYYNTNNLREVFGKVKDAGAELGVQLFQLHQPIRPMLADRKSYSDLKKLLVNLEVFVETKLDGERIQCHFSRDGNIRLFSRNAVDYTYLYGKALKDVIEENVLDVQACILDGELIVWDTNNDRPLPFGKNKTVALEGESGGLYLCYVVFDILFIRTAQGEDQDLMQRPLFERKKILETTVRDVQHKFEKLKYAHVRGSKTVFELFNTAVDRGEEGLVVKRIDSPYIPNDRSNHWLKIKSEYFEGLIDPFDLIVVGGYFGSARRVGNTGSPFDHITVFLMAVINKLDREEPTKSVLVPFTKVGIGYSFEELSEIRAKLKDQWREYRGNVEYFPRWSPAASERPDVYIKDPSKSIVFEMIGAEIVPTERFPSGYTLRFPKVMNIRYDKPWDNAMTINELKYTVESYSRGVTDRNNLTQIREDQEPQPTRKRTRKEAKEPAGILSQFQDTDTSGVKTVSNLFEGKEFYVINSDTIPKPELETLIVSHSGRKVQNLLISTNIVISSRIDLIKVRNLLVHYDMDILKPEWVLDCIKFNTILPLKPKYLTHPSSQVSKYFEEYFTEYGDSYNMLYTNPQDLLEIASQYPDTKTLSPDWVEKSEYKDILTQVSIFKLTGYHIYVINTSPLDPMFKGKDPLKESIQTRILAYGGKVSQKIDTKTTHILVLGKGEDNLMSHLPRLDINFFKTL